MQGAWSGCFQGYRGEAMQDLGYELPRIPLPRTPVNKALCLGGGDAEGAYVRAWLYATRCEREGRGREARPAVGHLLGRMEPVVQLDGMGVGPG